MLYRRNKGASPQAPAAFPRARAILLAGTLLPAVALAWLALSLPGGASATALAQSSTPSPQAEAPAAAPTEAQATTNLLSIDDQVCLDCHGKPGMTLTLENGEVLDLTVSEEDHAASVHGELGYACVQCHTTVGNYPHPPFTAASRRDASIKLYPACQRCHASQYEKASDSVHARALESGNLQAAICTDCHTAHQVRRLTDPETHQLTPESRVWVPETCAKCHNAIYQKYLTSVHGSALVGEGNPDVPTCIDCHGVHNIEDPTTASFRLKSPTICAKCHTDSHLMAKYGISTNVLNTYVADFHGTTVTLFEKQSPDAQTNKPVCYDCHGIHDIQRVDDPVTGLQIKENLLGRCQKCHPDATANFPTAWLSHYIPSREHTPLVYYVNLFYQIFIPTLLGGMAVLVVLDVTRKIRSQRRKPVSAEHPLAQGEMAQADPAQPEEAAEEGAQSEAAEAEISPEEPDRGPADQGAIDFDEVDRGETEASDD